MSFKTWPRSVNFSTVFQTSETIFFFIVSFYDDWGEGSRIKFRLITNHKHWLDRTRFADCELYLLPAESGRLSSRDLPLTRGQQQQQCVVRFAQRHRARLVVDIVKLNVPCKRGRLQVSGHQPVCGKLEDLREADRHYVLDAGRSPPPTVTSKVNRYAFSVVYRLAANCFDNDVAQQNGTVVFTPGSECRYKVTQPYGYRLRLLINSVPFGHQTADADAAVTADYDHVATTAKTMTVSIQWNYTIVINEY